jgi:hypothetical protein
MKFEWNLPIAKLSDAIAKCKAVFPFLSFKSIKSFAFLKLSKASADFGRFAVVAICNAVCWRFPSLITQFAPCPNRNSRIPSLPRLAAIWRGANPDPLISLA